jgi:hypothetical protein
LALNADYNRPNPLTDYAQQEMGMYDTRYDELGEMDCRACHGESVMTRHHNTPIVLEQHTCSIENGGCHEITPEPPGVVVIRDCTTSGCHSWDDVYTNGWHHNTDLSAPENCVSCHNPNLVGQITPFSGFQECPPSVVTPTPFMCENCHWEQRVVYSGWTEGDPPPPEPDAGHPSTYDHYDPWGNFMGYHEYGEPILGDFDTHHMGFKGNVAAQCGQCHCNDPYPPIWDPYDAELIRYCERCHDVPTLHMIFPHVGPPGTAPEAAYEGWQAVGFHDPDPGPDPTSYLGDNADGFTGTDNFLQNEMCFGCHGGGPDSYDFGEVVYRPVIRIKPRGINPSAVQALAQVELCGEYFGDTYGEYTRVEVKRRIDGTEWIDMPVFSWADDRVVFEVPCRTLTPGNYRVRILNEYGVSNQVVLTFEGDG